MRALWLGAGLLWACASPKAEHRPDDTFAEAPPQPVDIGPFQTQRECDLVLLGGQKFEIDMQAVELEKALRGVADVTCRHFRLMPGTHAFITVPAPNPPRALTANELFAKFVEACEAKGVRITEQAGVYVVEQK
ncbi:MAG: hypothetical protein IPJ65_19505 [Archangiaceae bacterium]|nr:hypothetical protein [Archangiaceae bacterium]